MLYAEHKDNKEKFSEFFDKLPKITNGSTLASLNVNALLLHFPKLGVFASELDAKLQKLKRQGVSQSSLSLLAPYRVQPT